MHQLSIRSSKSFIKVNFGAFMQVFPCSI
ncbi:hypothetical protein [Bacillus alveayuensis]